jgi:integrase
LRVAEAVYQRIDRHTGKPVRGKYEFTYRDATGRQVWQVAKCDSKANAKAERAELVARMHRGERFERTSLTVGEVARLWLERGTGQTGRWAPSTLEGYERIVRRHIERSTDPKQKPLAGVKLRELSIDRVAAWSQANERALAPTTAVIALVALKPGLPVRRPPRLAREQPRRQARTRREAALDTETDGDPRTRSARALARTGRRLSAAVRVSRLHRPSYRGGARPHLGRHRPPSRTDPVHRQLSRRREHARLKTEAGRREVILAAPLARRLREYRLASHKAPTDFVFANTLGRSLDYRDVGEGFRQAIKRAGLQAPGKLTLHSLRHTFASLLIARRLDVVFVSRQLGHANPSITLSVYAHLYARADHATTARDALEASHTAMLATSRSAI